MCILTIKGILFYDNKGSEHRLCLLAKSLTYKCWLRQTLNGDTKIQQYIKNNTANDVHDNLIVMIWSNEILSLFWAISISHTKLEHNRSKTNMYTTSTCLWSLYSRYAVVRTSSSQSLTDNKYQTCVGFYVQMLQPISAGLSKVTIQDIEGFMMSWTRGQLNRNRGNVNLGYSLWFWLSK